MSTNSCSIDARAPSQALPLPPNAEVRLFAQTADTAWLVNLIAAHQFLSEIRSLDIQCWMLHVLEQDAARLSCQGWLGGPDLVSLLVPTRCLHPEVRRHGALWAEPTLPAAASTALMRPRKAGEGTS